MGKQQFVRDDRGRITHIRETSPDDRTSWLYEVDNSVAGQFFHGGKGRCVEVADHHGDGTTTAHEASEGMLDELLLGGRGRPK